MSSPPRVKVLVLQEAAHIQGFMRLLMKPRNGLPWSREDRTALRAHLKRLGLKLPALALFALPAGSLLLAALAFFLDRRRGRRWAAATRSVRVRSG